MCGFGYPPSADARGARARRARFWSGQSSRRRQTPTAGRCCRGSTRMNTATASTCGPARSIERWLPLGVRSNSRHPTTSRHQALAVALFFRKEMASA